MKRNRDASLAETFRHEGGYVDHPRDPGGATNMGITKATLEAALGRSVTKAEVKALSKEMASMIYVKRYIAPIRFDDLPDGLDHVTLDASVNSGVGRGPKWTQRALGVTADGKVGPATILAAKSCRDVPAAIRKATAARMGFLRGLKTWNTFSKGWSRRVVEVEAFAIRLALTSHGTAVTPVAAERVRQAEAQAKRDGAKAAGAPAAGGAGATQLPDGLPDWALIAFGAAVLVVALMYLGQRRIEKQRAAAFLAIQGE